MISRILSILGLFAGLACAGCGSPQSEPSDAAVGSVDRATANLHGGRLVFVQGYERGCQAAQHDGKPMLLFFTADWCQHCHAMAADALCQDSVVRLSREFTCVMVDADAEPKVCQQYHVRGYPTIQFLSPRGVPLNRVTGKQPPAQLVMEMQAALQAVARRIDEPVAR